VAQLLTEELAQIERYLREQGVIFNGSFTDSARLDTVYAAVNSLFKGVQQLKVSALDDCNFERVCYHLNYNISAVSPSDYARLLEACNNIPSDFYYNKIISQIQRCESAEIYTELASNRGTSQQEVILGQGDEVLNRTITVQDNRKVMRIWRENYLYECDRLSAVLHVVNYKDPVIAESRFIVNEGEFIQTLPGPVDPARFDDLYFFNSWR
jgi:hypothetical protein|tara:strand:+ start:1496 stop:2128 length:633 start_codon:yes stop_codon:yes gene_type:complete